MKIFTVILTLFLLSLTGCTGQTQSEITQEIPAFPSNTLSPYNLYTTVANYNLSKYEPEEGVYLGVYLPQTEDFKTTIKDFETIVNTSHAIYSIEQNIDEKFPIDFILSCYSQNKTPFITVNPSKTKDPFDITLLKNLAENLGSLNMPIFINLYESPHLNNYDEKEYQEFFRQAKIYFSIYAKNVALVLSINSSNIYDINRYYPGDNFIDWIGINIYETVTKDNKINKTLTELDYFYTTFQSKKPIFINLGISHFSNTTLDYIIEEKLQELERFFKTIPTKYPRLKLINYLNYDNFQETNSKTINNLSITDNKQILKAYKTLTKNITFINSLNTTKSSSKEIKKLDFLIYKQDDTFLIDKSHIETLISNLQIEDFNKDYFAITRIENNYYYDLNEIIKYYNLTINYDNENKNITLSNTISTP